MVKIDLSGEQKGCFMCGDNNSHGFHVNFLKHSENIVYFEMTVPGYFQGYIGIVHGGMISMMLDEVMANLFFGRGINCLTTEIKIRYLKALSTETPIKAFGKLEKETRKIGYTTGWIENEKGIRFAEAEGKFYLLRDDETDAGTG